jgi:tetratricopeptide (TPR) repeat protein
MSQGELRVITYGETVTGFDRSTVAANLMQLGNFSPQRIERILSGEKFVFKSGLNQAAADRYLSVLHKAGIVCSVEPMPGSVVHRVTCPMCGTVQDEAPSCVQCHVLLAKWREPANDELRTEYEPAVTYGEERPRLSTLSKLLIIALVVGMIGVGIAIGLKMVWETADPFYKEIIAQVKNSGQEFAEVAPPAIPPVQTAKPELSAAEMQEIIDLFEDRQFARLNSILTQIQTEFAADPTYEWKIVQSFNLFSDPYLSYRPLFDAWVEQYPQHFAPYLARGRFFSSVGWDMRGGKYASETSDQQFESMGSYFDLALVDLKTAIQFEPNLLPAYITQINIYKAQGPQAEQERATHKAQELFPWSYQLYKKILDANLPRWGGSYRLMNAYAHQANAYVDQNHQMPFLYGKVYVDQAWYAKREKHYQQAIELYTKALTYGEYIALYESRGHTFYKMNDPERALADYARALEIMPDYSGVLRKRATLYFNRGEYNKALADIQLAQTSLTERNKPILRWYRWAIKRLLNNNDPALTNYIFHANLYAAAKQSKPYPEGRPLDSLDVQSRFQAPPGTFPFGLTWFKGSLYMSSYRDEAGIYQLDPTDGKVLNSNAPDIVYKDQFGGLTADENHLYHVMGYYGEKLYTLDPASLESNGEQYLYSSQFQLGDLARHNHHTYAIAYHQSTNLNDYRLLKFSDDGKLRASFTIQPIEGRSSSPGLASDGTHLWVSMGSVFYKLDPDTGDVLDGYSVPDACYGLAWDGEKLWGVGDSGEFFTYALKK